MPISSNILSSVHGRCGVYPIQFRVLRICVRPKCRWFAVNIQYSYANKINS